MKYMLVNGLPTLVFDSLATIALALVMLLFGQWLKKHIAFLSNYCIPAPVIGGVIFAAINLALYSSGFINIGVSPTYQTDMQNMFFTCVGFGISLTLLTKGGRRLINYFILTSILIFLQAGASVSGALLTGLDPALAVLCGPAALAGGHGNAAAYGGMLEDMGHHGAVAIGMAAATFGLITGSFFGGPMAKKLISKYNLKRSATDDAISLDINQESAEGYSLIKLIAHIALICILVTAGDLIQNGIYSAFDIKIPAFAGAALLASIIRNVNDKYQILPVDTALMEKIQDFTLNVFLSLAMISLKLWQLASLALPMMLTLFVGLVVTLFFIYFIVFRFCGKNFDAAVMCAGMCGHGLGATPNGLANMDSITQVYGMSKIAYLCVIVTGGIVADWVLLVVNTTMVNVFGK